MDRPFKVDKLFNGDELFKVDGPFNGDGLFKVDGPDKDGWQSHMAPI